MKESGVIIVTDPGSDKPLLEVGTLQCCHCGQHWVSQRGSGAIRGFCFRCNGPVCGPRCAGDCIPSERLLENLEAGMPADYRPIVVPSGWGS